ncbi:MAG: PadR family transcriptional regulator [Candidatus Wallbacteria bacterium]|nr:PadR family transcriptional regulator [Candidatus Wallbacteria bacterium]
MSGASRGPGGRLTTPDLVVLSMLAERPMHGYELWRELEYREVADWAAICRAQVYYSLAKLARSGLIRPQAARKRSSRPDRVVHAPTAAARAALASALAREDWANQRPPNPFQTWLALSLRARKSDRRSLVVARRSFLLSQVEKEEKTLVAIRLDKGPMIPIALAMVELAIRQFRLELEWLEELGPRIAP